MILEFTFVLSINMWQSFIEPLSGAAPSIEFTVRSIEPFSSKDISALPFLRICFTYFFFLMHLFHIAFPNPGTALRTVPMTNG